MAMERSWFRKYVTNALGDVHDYFLASMYDECYFITQLEKGGSIHALEMLYDIVKYSRRGRWL